MTNGHPLAKKFGDGGFVLLKENWLQGGILNNLKITQVFF
jgi:hypothetical protein